VISPDITGVKTHGCEIKVKKQQLNIMSIVLYLIYYLPQITSLKILQL
jgi:hypothetical protein